jgi:hypothetical protein
MNWTHNQLANDLAEHLNVATNRIVWTDMQLGAPGTPRPDVYAFNKSFSRFCPLAYEVKVSVSDFRSDVMKGKWQSYLKFASGVIFAVPKGLITKEDLPKGCGLIVRSEGGWKTVKGPTLHTLTDLPRDFWIKLVCAGVDRSLREHTRCNMNKRYIHDLIEKKYGRELAIALAQRDKAQYALDEKTKHIKEKTGELDVFSALESVRYEIRGLKELRSELCSLLGVNESADKWSIQSALASKLILLDKDKTLSQMRLVLTQAFRQMERQLSDLEDLTAPLMQGGDQ